MHIVSTASHNKKRQIYLHIALLLLTFGQCIQAATLETNLTLILRQLDTIDRITQSSAALPADDNARYSFDYPRLSAEIELIRQGIKAYQFPTRAKPRTLPEITGSYSRPADQQP